MLKYGRLSSQERAEILASAAHSLAAAEFDSDDAVEPVDRAHVDTLVGGVSLAHGGAVEAAVRAVVSEEAGGKELPPLAVALLEHPAVVGRLALSGMLEEVGVSASVKEWLTTVCHGVEDDSPTFVGALRG